jgi:hypothetical protein
VRNRPVKDNSADINPTTCITTGPDDGVASRRSSVVLVRLSSLVTRLLFSSSSSLTLILEMSFVSGAPGGELPSSMLDD